MNRRGVWMILLAFAAIAGCDGSGTKDPGYESDAYPPGWGKDLLGDTPGVGCMSQSVWARPDFTWKMTGVVDIQVTVVHLDGTAWPDVVVQVFDDASDLPGNQTLLAKGLTDEAGVWVGTAVVPSNQDAVTIIVNIMGAKSWDRVPVADGQVVVEFGRE